MEKYQTALYIRLSYTDDKTNESDSVQNQRRILQSFVANQPDMEVVCEKVDDGYSGIIFDRPAFKEMMADIEARKINCVIVKDLSRLGREYIETGRYLRRIFPTYGVRFIAINDHIDTLEDRGDDLVVSVKSVLNDAYCRDISVKTRSALNAKRESGAYVGASPVYGYRKGKNQLVVDPYTSQVVRDIYRHKMDGMSGQKIAETLNTAGVLSPSAYKKDRGLPLSGGGYCNNQDGKWSARAVLRILTNEVYTGTLVQNKQGTLNYKIKDVIDKPESEWKRHENAHDAIVSKADFDVVQRLLRLDVRATSQGDTAHIFSGLLICDCCGGAMTRKTVTLKGKSYHYYYCRTTKKQGCLHGGRMKESQLTDCVLAVLQHQVMVLASVEEMMAGEKRQLVVKAMSEQLTTQLVDIKAQLNKVTKYKSSLYENLVAGMIAKEDYKDLKEKYGQDEERLTQAVRQVEGELADVVSGKSQRLQFLEQFRAFQNVSQLDRNTVVRLIQHIRVISKTELRVTFQYQDEYDSLMDVLAPLLSHDEGVA